MRLKKHLILRQIGEKSIIITPSTGSVDLTHVHHLNTTAALLWKKLINTDFSDANVREILLQEYDVDEDMVRADSINFINYLKEHDFLDE
ncbi:MAG: PqqD family protein [Bacteroidales bacterium]